MYGNGEPLTDADLDRELTAALAVEPSPEFLARVRMRIGQEPEPSSWRPSWALATAAVFAVAIGVALTVVQTDQTAMPRLVASLAAVVPPMASGPLTVAVAASRARNTRSQKPTEEMRAVMNANAEASEKLRAHLKDRDYGALAADAETYRQNFAYLEGFWTSKRVDGAVQISRAGVVGAAALDAAAHARDPGALEAAIAAILGTCGACHKHYREELPDGSYEIRL
jgi:hypothetical protein